MKIPDDIDLDTPRPIAAIYVPRRWRAVGVAALLVALGIAFAAPAPMPPSAIVLIGATAIGGILAIAKGDTA